MIWLKLFNWVHFIFCCCSSLFQKQKSFIFLFIKINKKNLQLASKNFYFKLIGWLMKYIFNISRTYTEFEYFSFQRQLINEQKYSKVKISSKKTNKLFFYRISLNITVPSSNLLNHFTENSYIGIYIQ